MCRNKLHDGMDLVPQVGHSVERGYRGNRAGYTRESAKGVEDRYGGVDQRTRHHSEGEAEGSSEELELD